MVIVDVSIPRFLNGHTLLFKYLLALALIATDSVVAPAPRAPAATFVA